MEPQKKRRERQLLCGFGDSLTAGVFVEPELTFLALLGDRFGMETRNAGVPGQTTSEAMPRLEPEVLEYRPAVCTVLFGMNDHTAVAENLAKVPVGEFESNLREIVRRLRAAGTVPVLCTIHSVLEGNREAYYYNRHPKEWYGEPVGVTAWISRYNEAVRRAARDEGAALADVAAAWAIRLEKGERPEELLLTLENSGRDDGVHLTPKGHQVYADEIGRVMAELVSA
ncbi:hypothetical protein J31TS4_05000 [Paenibacillus sp. J31TS4]|uniref:SGNH/GDSL hydrolase family protein n=1 Tax=Paenibacillus sp. J31TS4 TaxID=2807195 RepID=UPI001B2A1BE4|nr:SGNH/GDSL hydrolase family protein [Paenibacillus sp. J31TS4]GIP37220.1 hypothetical protein J31TS4_05000 [Paenibacillus sp. J31TS4]